MSERHSLGEPCPLERKYKVEATWDDTTHEGDVAELYPEIQAVFDSPGLRPTEVCVRTFEGMCIKWTRVDT